LVRQHDHLEGNIDADRREADDDGDGVLQPQRRECDERRYRTHDDERRGRNMVARRHAAQVLAAENHLIPGIREYQSACSSLQTQEAGNE
jgi:hypothetical protein